MKNLRPCVMLWVARSGGSELQNAAYDKLHALVNPPEGRSMIMSGEEEELVAVEDHIDGLPFGEHYAAVAIALAKRKGFDRVTFIAAIFFRNSEEAPMTSASIDPVYFVGKFDFPFPERGDHVPRDEHGWLGIDATYCADEQREPEDDDGYIGHF